MESDAEFSKSDAEEEQLKIAELEPQPIEKPKNTMPSSTASSTVSSWFFSDFLGISKLVKFDVI